MFKKIVLFTLLFIPVSLLAQEKIAYFNSGEVIMAMPEYTQMQDSLQKTQEAFRKEMSSMEDEYSKKYQAFMAEADGLVESIKVRRMQEIQDIEQKASNFNEQSQQQLQQLYEQLMTPIQQKIREAIQTVGAENNYTYILEAGATVLYVSPTATDATPLVKKKLGLQ